MNKVLKLSAAMIFATAVSVFAMEAAPAEAAVKKVEEKAAKVVEEKKADANKSVEKAEKKVEEKVEKKGEK